MVEDVQSQRPWSHCSSLHSCNSAFLRSTASSSRQRRHLETRSAEATTHDAVNSLSSGTAAEWQDLTTFHFSLSQSIQLVEERRQRLQDYLRLVVRLCTEPRSVQGKRRRHQLDPIMKPDIDRDTLQDILPFFRFHTMSHSFSHTPVFPYSDFPIHPCFHTLIFPYTHVSIH